MPNHVTHRVVVTGEPEKVRAFVDRCIVTKDFPATEFDDAKTATLFDFETLIPMPDELRGTVEGGTLSIGLAVIGKQKLHGTPFPITPEDVLKMAFVAEAGVTSLDEMRAFFEEQHPDYIVEAEAAIARYEKYGALTWYDWSVGPNGWGTKWNSYSFRLVSDEPGRYEFQFETAWSTPDNIWDKVAVEFPDLHFEIVGYDEGHNFAVEGSIYEGANHVDCIDPTSELYERVYDEPMPNYDEDDEGAPDETPTTH